VVIPAYQAEATIGAVVRAALAAVGAVIVVDDGSTDGTRAALQTFAGSSLTVVFHEGNLGKGAALRTGFERAHELGFTHAVTLDADGQHDPVDAPSLIELARGEPRALILGVRTLNSHVPGLLSRVLRAHSNGWIRLATGQSVPDSQTGFRVYPLAWTLAAGLRGRRYDFEAEVILRALHDRLPVLSAPVRTRYGAGTPSQFRRVRDSLLVLRCFASGLKSGLRSRWRRHSR
jgi:glycosyltransferase involved in cell wall biosynthesis